MTPSPCQPRRVGLKHVLFILKSQFRILTSGQVRTKSGQGQIMTQVGQYAYYPKRLDQPSRLALFARIYLHPVATYSRKAVFDLI